MQCKSLLYTPSSLTVVVGTSNISFLRLIVKLEVHSVHGAHVYLRQSCFDGRLNKTIVKPRVALASGRANTYAWDFPDVKFRVA